MIIIGEKINIRSTAIGQAMQDRDPKPIQEMAKAQVAGGADYLDVNVGPATKGGPELMEWLVKTIQEVVDIPLSLDTGNADAIEAGLKVHKGRALINSISGEQGRLEKMLPLLKKYDADVIGLALTDAGIPRDANERVAAAVEVITALTMEGISLERLFLDPIVTPICFSQQDAMEIVEAIKLFKQINDPPIKTVVGLSNVYNGCPEEVKGLIGRTFFALLAAVGLDAAIADPLEKEFMDVVKTMKVFKNDILYCHSYLEQ
jgi:5-methyltetrahydrofolate corrinoid/iron sulfur protein methyltransferase